MTCIQYITGPAGTGKTYTLAEEMINWFDNHELKDFQSILALTRMHGSRRRLVEKLQTKNLPVRLCIRTVDSFALFIVNRWRLALDITSPIFPGEPGGFIRTDIGTQASFSEIMQCAAALTASPFIAQTIANKYPLILIDEFQDSIGDQLNLLQNLKPFVDLIIAADPFQALDGDESACNWVESSCAQEAFPINRLTVNRRSKNRYIIEAAHAVLHNQPAKYSTDKLPFLCVPSYSLAPWKVIPSRNTQSTFALIFPAQKIFDSLWNASMKQNQNRKAQGKTDLPFPWRIQPSEKKRMELVKNEITGAQPGSKIHSDILDEAFHISKLMGFPQVTDSVLDHLISASIRQKKLYSVNPIKYEAMTTHSAKNREFDHVFIIWDNHACSNLSEDLRRRRLYNAITRAKLSCTVVVIGSKASIEACPVLSLLGTPKEHGER